MVRIPALLHTCSQMPSHIVRRNGTLTKYMNKKKLTIKSIDEKMKKMSGWAINATHTQISKVYPINSFVDGLAFIARVTVYAEILQHHPEITLTRTKVKVALASESVKGLTQHDFEIAHTIDRLHT